MNVLDYIKKYGDKDFIALKFNELDGVVFSALSYIRFEELINSNYFSIQEIIASFENFNKKEREKYYMYDDDEKLLTNISNSKRYDRLNIIDKLTYFNKDATTQFFAYAVRLSDDEVVVVYRGTDQTLLGWYESLKLGFDEYIGGQQKSKEFLERLIRLYPNDKFYVVGHSKGGNYAVYAAASLIKKYQESVVSIYNYDGPSLLKKTKDKTNYYNIKSKITTFIPCDSVIGIVLGNDTKVKVVDSDFVSFAQHVYYFWKVEGTHFKKGKRRTLASNAFEKTFPSWVLSMSDDDLREYIKILYDWTVKAKISKTTDFIDIKKVNKLITIISKEKNKKAAKFGEEVIKFIKSFIDCILLKIISGNI